MKIIAKREVILAPLQAVIGVVGQHDELLVAQRSTMESADPRRSTGRA